MSETATPPTPDPNAPKNGVGGSDDSLDLSKIWSHIEQAARIAGVAALATYVLGLLVVNLYLFQIGVTDFAILRTRYILTGIVVTLAPLPLLICILMGIVVVQSIVSEPRKSQSESRQKLSVRSKLVLGTTAIVAPTLPLGFILFGSGIEYRSSLLSPDLSALPVVVFVSSLTTVLTATLVISGWRRNEPLPELNSLQKLAFWVVGIVIAVFVFFLCIDLFASTFYPIIPEQFGGGRPKQVQIVLADDSSVGNDTLGVSSFDPPTIRGIDLLWETEQMYVVRDRSEQPGRVIQIDRDEVSAIVLDLGTTPATPAPATPTASPIPDR